MDNKNDKPVMGIPYNPTNNNPYKAGKIPPNAIVGDPKGVPIKQTIYRDTPAPINCPLCGSSGVTKVRYLLIDLEQILELKFLAPCMHK